MPPSKTLFHADNKTPERPGSINRNLLTPCRQVGLSRKRKTPSSTQKNWENIAKSDETPRATDLTSITKNSKESDEPKKDLAASTNSNLYESENTALKHATKESRLSKTKNSTKKLDSLPAASKLEISKVDVANNETGSSLQRGTGKLRTRASKSSTKSDSYGQVSEKLEVEEAESRESSEDYDSPPPRHVTAKLKTRASRNRKSGSSRYITDTLETSETSESSDDFYSPSRHVTSQLKTRATKSNKKIASSHNMADKVEKFIDSECSKTTGATKPNTEPNFSKHVSRALETTKSDEQYDSVDKKSSKHILRPLPSSSSEKSLEVNTLSSPIECKASGLKENVPELSENCYNDNKPLSTVKSPARQSKKFRKSLSMKKTYSDDSIEFESNIDKESLTSIKKKDAVVELECFDIDNIISQHTTSKVEPLAALDHSDDFTPTPEEDKFSKDELINQIRQLEEFIKTKKDRLNHLKQAQSYQKMHSIDDLKSLFTTWKKGCVEALNDLLPHLSTHGDIDMPTLLKNLQIPPDLITISPQQELV